MPARQGGTRVVWARVAAGGLLVLAAGVLVVWPAFTGGRWAWWGAGLGCGLGLYLVATAFPKQPSGLPPQSMWEATARRLPSGMDPPLVGGLLVYKYGLITEAQLTQALVKQRATSQKLGEVLIEMGLVTAGQVAIALADQQTGGDPFGSGRTQPEE